MYYASTQHLFWYKPTPNSTIDSKPQHVTLPTRKIDGGARCILVLYGMVTVIVTTYQRFHVAAVPEALLYRTRDSSVDAGHDKAIKSGIIPEKPLLSFGSSTIQLELYLYVRPLSHLRLYLKHNWKSCSLGINSCIIALWGSNAWP